MLCRRCLRFALAVFVANVAAAADARWPALTGDLSGVVRLDALGDSPPLAWSTRVQPSSDGALRVDLDVSARGLAVHAQVTLPAGAESPGEWRILDGTIDLETWLPVALAKAGATSLPSDLTVTGPVRIVGEGTWRDAEISGALKVTLDGGAAGSVAQSWSTTGLGLVAEIALEKNLPALRTLQLYAESLSAAGVTARRVVVEAGGVAGGRLEVRRAEVEVFGGRVALAPFTLDPTTPSVNTAADLVGVALGDLAALAPQAVAEARGQVAGRIAVRWDAQAGAEPGAGLLSVNLGIPATVRLAASPGFLTERVPARFNLAGESLGPISRALSLKNPAYETLRRIELGELPLVVDGLVVKLYPDGLDGAVSARLELSGHPAEAKSAVGTVSFSVNVTGPLSQVLRLGMKPNSSMNFGAGR
jgi:hypothetical protein